MRAVGVEYRDAASFRPAKIFALGARDILERSEKADMRRERGC